MMSINESKKMCKNGCGLPAVKRRNVCKECQKQEGRDNWARNKKYYERPKKEKIKKVCLECGKEFETAIDHQKFCSSRGKTSCKYKYNYKQRTQYQLSRSRAKEKIYDKGKKRTTGYVYTESENRYIIKNYGKKSAIEIAEKLDRPVNGIRWKIRKLKDELQIIEQGVF
jgi:hypothetical protein